MFRTVSYRRSHGPLEIHGGLLGGAHRDAECWNGRRHLWSGRAGGLDRGPRTSRRPVHRWRHTLRGSAEQLWAELAVAEELIGAGLEAGSEQVLRALQRA